MSEIPTKPYQPSSTVEAAIAALVGPDYMELFNLFHRLRAISRLLDLLVAQYQPDEPLSAARMRLLVRLAVDQRVGNTGGISPSELSRFLGVSRNTTSALLNGLEEQGLIERHPHPTDRRQFLVKITPVGQELASTHAPQFAAFITSLFTPLSIEERATLRAMLNKLKTCLLERSAELGLNIPAHEAEPAAHNQP